MFLRLFPLLFVPFFLLGQIKAVVFPFDSVVSVSDQKLVRQWLMNSFRITEPEAQESLEARWEFIDRGGSDREFWEQYVQGRGMMLAKGWFFAWNFVINNYLVSDPEVLSVVHRLQAAGYLTPMFSKVDAYHIYAAKMPGAADSFTPVSLIPDFCSDDEYLASYDSLLKTMGLDPSEMLFIEASPGNAELIRSREGAVVLYRSPAQLIQALAEKGVYLPD